MRSDDKDIGARAQEQLYRVGDSGDCFATPEEAVTELAFSRYPVAVTSGGERRIFDSFDAAKAFVLASLSSEKDAEV